jgi:hypothetical protein
MALDEPKGWLSMIVGLVLLVIGLIPLLNGWSVIPFGLPSFLTGLISSIIVYLIAIGALYLIIEAFIEDIGDPIGKITLIVGILIFALGIITLLNSFGVIGFSIPFLNEMIYNILFMIEGIFLVIAAFVM